MNWPNLKLSPRAGMILLRIGIGLAVLYVVFGSYVWWTMHQPPKKFARVISRIPKHFPFLLFPFETAWMHARAGQLTVGDPAPDFNLLKLDKRGTIQLSALNQSQPVVLDFGSYT